MRHRTRTFAAPIVLLTVAGPLRAQEVADLLPTLAEENGGLYVQPVAEGLGHALGSGFIRTPSVHEVLGFDIGVRIITAVVPADRKTFAPVLPDSVTAVVGGVSRTFTDPYAVPGDGRSPTAAGAGVGATLVPSGAFADTLAVYGVPASDFELPLPDGADIPAMPFVTLQAGIGVGLGTELTVRLTPTLDYGEAGRIGGGGFGVAHSVNRWLPRLLVDVAVFAGYQTFRVGDYLDATTTAFGAAVGKGLGPVSAYLIGQYERPSAEITYVSRNPDGNPALPPDGQRVAFDAGLDAGTRLGLGAQLDVLLVQLAGEYTRGAYDAFTLRASLGLR